MKKIVLILLVTALGLGIGVGIWLRQARGGFLRTPIGTIPIPPSSTTPAPVPMPTPAPTSTILKNTTGLTVPAGFGINVFAHGLGKPRVIERGVGGHVWVSIPASGKIVALPDKNGDGVADNVITVISGLNRPHGFAYRCPNSQDTCQLYVAEANKVTQFDVDQWTMQASNPKKIIDLPGGGRHTTRSLLWLPGSNHTKLLVSIGSSCDVCHETDARRGTIQVLDIASGVLKPYATGLRNSVFMAEHPSTHEVWATDMGRDFLGDALPPDEINIIAEGKNYGWPVCFGKNIHDDAFDKNTYIRNPCLEPFETPSYIDIPAHSAPLGLAFVPDSGWPTNWQRSLLVAYHGSWNRTMPTGYKLVSYPNGQAPAEDFITGFTKNGKTIGRPSGILVEDTGVAYITDDFGGNVYRLTAPGR